MEGIIFKLAFLKYISGDDAYPLNLILFSKSKLFTNFCSFPIPSILDIIISSQLGISFIIYSKASIPI